MTRLHWASSRTIGGVSEIAVLAPIRQGVVPGERRSYEENLRDIIANLARRHEQGLPTELDPVTSIHFGRLMILRPEQYLRRSELLPGDAAAQTGAPVPSPFDAYAEAPYVPSSGTAEQEAGKAGTDHDRLASLRSWLLVLVEFDGELRTYMRDIARSVSSFDAIFRNCEEYPGANPFEPFWLWVKRYQVPVELLYTRYPDLSVVRLKQLEAFKHRFDAFVAQVRSPAGPRVRSLDDAFDAFLRDNQQFAGGFPSAGGVYPKLD